MGILSNLFSKKPKHDALDFSVFGIDMHSHLLPGIDDGAKTIEHSLGMILKFNEMGYRKLIMTPHIMEDYYKNTPEIILEKLDFVRQEIKNYGIEMELEAAAEYYFDETLIEKIKNKEVLTFGDNHVLFEYSFGQEPQQISTLLFQFKVNGYKPILAHYERYPYYHNNPEKIREYRDNGILIQLNLLSLTGHYGPGVERMAKYLVDNQLVDFVGSDCHRIEHLQILEANAKNPYFHKVKDLNLLNKSL
ncbi:MAG: CpsB/CapC family capsule biosynthesis tyrosine phosphatase [Bacteroidota bacterium]